MRFFQVLVSILALVGALSSASAATFGKYVFSPKAGQGPLYLETLSRLEKHLASSSDVVFIQGFDLLRAPRTLDVDQCKNEYWATITWRTRSNANLQRAVYAYCPAQPLADGTFSQTFFYSDVHPDLVSTIFEIGFASAKLETNVSEKNDNCDDQHPSPPVVKQVCLESGYEIYGYDYQETTKVGNSSVHVSVTPVASGPMSCLTVTTTLVGQGPEGEIFGKKFGCKGAPSYGINLQVYGYTNAKINPARSQSIIIIER